MEPAQQRLGYLDSLRGIASLSVVLYHFIGGFEPSIQFLDKTQIHLWSIVFNGQDAVSFFFVLSGLVLSMKYFQGRHANQPIHYRNFAIARLYRLYPAFWVSLICYYLYSIRGGNIKVFQSLTDLLTEATLFRNFAPLYGAGWTLNVELVLSLCLPFLILLIRYDRKLFNIFLLLSVLFSVFMSLFILHFMLGILLAYHFQTIAEYDLKAHRWYRYRYGIVLLVALAYSIRPIYNLFPLPKVYAWLKGLTGFDFFQVTGLATFCFLALVINQPKAQRFLSKPLFLFLGKISYGMYLVHWFWLFYIINPRFRVLQGFLGWNDFYTALAVGGLLLVLTITSATLLYHFVELPWIRKGKRRMEG